MDLYLNLKKLLKKKVFISFFFITLFAIGVTITKDYGISYDEPDYRLHGFTVLNYLGEKILPNKLNKIKEKRNLEYSPPYSDWCSITINFEVF